MSHRTPIVVYDELAECDFQRTADQLTALARDRTHRRIVAHAVAALERSTPPQQSQAQARWAGSV